MTFDRNQIRACSADLAAHGVYLGTSSWKYEGWIGQLYTAERYAYRGKLAKSRFQKGCLAEYAEVFKTVCVDAAYYDFPRRDYLLNLAETTPDDFRFGFKVTDTITIKKFPKLDRFGDRAGLANENFLNANLFADAFLSPCEAIRNQVGILMFEFSRFWPSDYARGRDFLDDLDTFLGKLPRGWPYGIELRNARWLVPDYFACLTHHGMTHVFNSWDAMPSVAEQHALPGSTTHDSLVASRFLLKPGRKYADAVNRFQPYDRVREPYPEARQAGAKLIQEGRTTAGRQTFIFANNRLEGNALSTLAGMIDELP
jgi:uncharacterized protein YecE (DUF72 family)